MLLKNRAFEGDHEMDRGKNWDILLIAATLFITIVPSRFFNDPEIASRVYEWCQGLILALWMFHLIHTVPSHKMNRRSIVAAATIWQVVDIITYWPWYFHKETSLWFYVSVTTALFFGSLVVYEYFRIYDIESDEFNPDKVYILLWRPTKVRSIFLSLIGMPVGSVAVYANGCIWSFKWNRNGFIKRPFRPRAAIKKYIFFNTGKDTTNEIVEELQSLVDRRARVAGYRCRCIYIIRNVLKKLGKEYTPNGIEYVPSIYAMKVMRLKK